MVVWNLVHNFFTNKNVLWNISMLNITGMLFFCCTNFLLGEKFGPGLGSVATNGNRTRHQAGSTG